MPLFGFAINFNNGATDYVVASGPSVEYAEEMVTLAVEDCDGGAVESIVHYDAEALLEEQYRGVGILSSQFGGC